MPHRSKETKVVATSQHDLIDPQSLRRFSTLRVPIMNFLLPADYNSFVTLMVPNDLELPCVEKYMEFCRVTSTHTQTRTQTYVAWLPKRPLSSPPVCATAPREGTPLTVNSIKAHYGLSS
ncbi:hypothetical protein G5I_14217 [Acromyrmex echinatior]|uniref:Uncharacterized protein n=1 Tax=Acromyrmex echinatior TaxID=103372 RepID=F4X779_ACREC|nr:hypothetical protein G5I_14217 [Acromyrmex echinatior]